MLTLAGSDGNDGADWAPGQNTLCWSQYKQIIEIDRLINSTLGLFYTHAFLGLAVSWERYWHPQLQYQTSNTSVALDWVQMQGIKCILASLSMKGNKKFMKYLGGLEEQALG